MNAEPKVDLKIDDGKESDNVIQLNDKDADDKDKILPVIENSSTSSDTQIEPEFKENKSCITVDHPFPIIGFLKRYKLEYLQYDIIVGLTAGIIAIPQGMSNALLANIPPVYGLYGGIIPVFVYSLLTTSYQVHIGPYALISLMCASFVSFIDYEKEESEYITAVLTLAFLSGCFLTVLSFFRLGIITRVLSDTVVNAFTAASAISITTSQIVHFWGVKTGSGSCFAQILYLFSKETISHYNWYSFILGITSSILLYSSKIINQKYFTSKPLPLELFIMILYILIVWGFDLKIKWNIKYIGDYPVIKGFPPFTLPSAKYMIRLLPYSVIIGIICFSSTISLGKSYARQVSPMSSYHIQFNYHLDDNQELFAIGASNLVGAFFASIPTSASISRSSLVASIGGKTPLFCLFSPVVVLICLYFLMDWLKYLPNAVLSTVVIINMFTVFKKFKILPKLWRSSTPDFWSFMVCTIMTVFASTEIGLLSGVIASFLFLWYGLYHRKLPVVSTDIEMKNMSGQNKVDINVIDGGESLYFLNRDSLVLKVEQDMHKKSTKQIYVDLRRITYIDVSGMNAIHDIYSMFNNNKHHHFLLISDDYIPKKMESYEMKDVTFTKSIATVI